MFNPYYLKVYNHTIGTNGEELDQSDDELDDEIVFQKPEECTGYMAKKVFDFIQGLEPTQQRELPGKQFGKLYRVWSGNPVEFQVTWDRILEFLDNNGEYSFKEIPSFYCYSVGFDESGTQDHFLCPVDSRGLRADVLKPLKATKNHINENENSTEDHTESKEQNKKLKVPTLVEFKNLYLKTFGAESNDYNASLAWDKEGETFYNELQNSGFAVPLDIVEETFYWENEFGDRTDTELVLETFQDVYKNYIGWIKGQYEVRKGFAELKQEYKEND